MRGLRWTSHGDLAIRKTPTVGREEYLDYMTFRRNDRPLFTEIFGPIVGLKEEWAEQGATPSELDFSAFRYRCEARGWIPVNTGRNGGYPEQEIEESAEYRMWRDGLGRTMKLPKGIATLPVPLTFPVRTMDDWLKIKPWYVFSEDRFGGDWEAAARLFDQDSDGDMNPVIDAFLEAGVNAMHPMEPAAGMDIVKIRQKYGQRLAFTGGLDKHVLRRSREEIVRELEHKIPPQVFVLYHFTHSLVVAGLVLWLLRIIARPLVIPALAWPVHIVMDSFTHGSGHWQTLVLYPLSDWHVRGVNWWEHAGVMLGYWGFLPVLWIGIHLWRRGGSRGVRAA